MPPEDQNTKKIQGEIIALQQELAVKMVSLWQSELSAMATHPDFYEHLMGQMAFFQAMNKPPIKAETMQAQGYEDDTKTTPPTSPTFGATPTDLESLNGDEFHQQFASWLKEFQRNMERMAKPE